MIAVAIAPAALEAVRAALAQASLYRALSLLYRSPEGRTAAEVCGIADALEPSVAAPLCRLARRIGDALDEAVDLHHRTFTPAGPCPTGESDYSQNQLGGKGGILGDVAAFYAAFGFDPAGELRESPDHVAVELSFAAWLCVKEAYALSDGREDAARLSAEARETFRREHLEPLMAGLCGCLCERAPGTLYGDLGAATLALLP